MRAGAGAETQKTPSEHAQETVASPPDPSRPASPGPLMQLLAPMVRAWSHRLAGRPLRERMRLLPIGAAVALAAIFLVSVTLGVLDPRSLTRIQRDYYPALRAGQDMRETLTDLQNALQNAAATQDANRLSEMDSLSSAFLAAAAESRAHSDNGARAEAMGYMPCDVCHPEVNSL